MMKYYPSMRKKVALPFVTAQMHLGALRPREISQIEKEKSRTDIAYTWTLETRVKLAERDSGEVVARDCGGAGSRERLVKVCKLPALRGRKPEDRT